MRQAQRQLATVLAVGTALGVVARAESPHPLMPAPGPYRVYEMPERTDLLTPEGTRKEVYGNFGPDGQGSYRVEIPMAALKPSPTPTDVPPTAAPTVATTPAATTPIPTPTLTPTPTLGPTMTTLLCAPTPTITATPAAERRTASDDTLEDIDPLVVKANRLYNKRRYVEASEYVDEILRRRPDYVRGWLMRGSLHQMLGHRDLAEAAWARAKELSGDDATVTRALGGRP